MRHTSELTAALLLAAVLVLASGVARADMLVPGDYFLLDHPDGALSPQPYGLRLDILEPPAGVGPTFSTTVGGARVVLSWDGGSTASITGTIFNNHTGNLWTVDHRLTGVSVLGGPNGGFTASGGTLTANVATDDVALYGASVFTFFSVPEGGEAFIAAGDGHRCGGHPDCGPLVATGWLNLSGEPTKNGGATVEDWLVQLTPVPLPAPVFLLLGGLVLLRTLRIRRGG